MKVKALALNNFRSHARLFVEFENDVTVIVGENGEGKTSLLDAISQIFGRLLTGLPGLTGIAPRTADIRLLKNSRMSSGLHIWLDLDVHNEFEALPFDLQQKFVKRFQISRSKLRDRSPATIESLANEISLERIQGTKPLDLFAEILTQAENEGKNYVVPLIVYYGTSRAVFETPLRRRNFKTHFPRFDSMNGALHSSANFKRVFEWFHAKESEESATHRRERSFEYRDPELHAVREAIEKFFTGFSNPRTILKPLRFVVDKEEFGQKVTFDLNQLSDGYRTTIAMIADLACRMVEANPPGILDSCLSAQAVVLIDEIDLHLHPRWQQRIIPDLLRVFPNTQFIVTTHSPQVLTSVEPRCIRKLIVNEESTEIVIPNFSFGARSVDMLEMIQGVDARPPNEIAAKLFHYKELVEREEWDSEEANALRADLDAWAATREPELRRIDVDIQMRKMRRRRSEKG